MTSFIKTKKISQKFSVWGVYLLAWCNKHLPFVWQMRLGRALGYLLYYAMPRRRKIAEKNIQCCLKPIDRATSTHILKENFRSFGQGLMETGLAWFGTAEQLVQRSDFSGHEHVDQALQKGRGLILLGTHMHALDLFGRLALMHLPVVPTYRPMKNKQVNKIMEAARAQHFPEVIERHAVRDMIKILRANRILWLAVDQDYGARHSAFVPFFGIPAATVMSVVKLADLTGAAVAMVETQRERDPLDPRYRIQILPAFEGYPTGDLQADLLKINQAIEQLILHDPTQYMWQHRRFKTRPTPGPSWYE